MALQPPPRDPQGEVLPHDHIGIASDDGIIRRISENQVVADSTGQRRVSSKAFKPSSGPNGGMSVDLEKLIIEANQDPRAYVTTPRWTGSARFEAGALREVERSGANSQRLNNAAFASLVYGSLRSPGSCCSYSSSGNKLSRRVHQC